MYIVDMSPDDFERGMKDGFWVQAWTAFVSLSDHFYLHSVSHICYVQAASKEMARQGKKGKIILISSTLGYMSFVGYGNYAPAKHALRGTSFISSWPSYLHSSYIQVLPNPFARKCYCMVSTSTYSSLILCIPLVSRRRTRLSLSSRARSSQQTKG